MRSYVRPGAIALAAILGACASTPAPVPVEGPASDLTPLVGEWVGEYSSAATGRSGSISFTLTARGDTAYGDVVMIPVGWGRQLRPWPEGDPGGPPRVQPQVLTISFVHVEGDRVSGMLAPYADPETGTRLVTRFDGRVRADTVAGSFTTWVERTSGTQMGGWRVVRRR